MDPESLERAEIEEGPEQVLWSYLESPSIQGLAAVYGHYFEVCVEAAYGITRDHGEAEDVVQDLFTGLLERPLHVAELSDARGFLIQRVKLRARDALRKRDRLRKVHREASRQPARSRETGSSFLDLKEALDSMGGTVRAAFAFHYFLGFSVRETAGLLGSRETVIKWVLAEGRRRLRGKLSPDHP